MSFNSCHETSNTVFDGSMGTVLTHAFSIEGGERDTDEQSCVVSVGKQRFRMEEPPRAGVMKPKTPGEGEPRDGGKARPPAGGRSKDDKNGGNKVGGNSKGGSGANNQSKGGKGNVKKSL
jgi:hypothetical protein